jgi:hypothetical protein
MARQMRQADARVDEEMDQMDRRLTALEQRGNIPIGGMLPYTKLDSTDPPPGFLWCDGTEYARQRYPRLFEALEGSAKGSSSGEAFFVLPNVTLSGIRYIIRAE